jgi:hypothetical protein
MHMRSWIADTVSRILCLLARYARACLEAARFLQVMMNCFASGGPVALTLLTESFSLHQCPLHSSFSHFHPPHTDLEHIRITSPATRKRRPSDLRTRPRRTQKLPAAPHTTPSTTTYSSQRPPRSPTHTHSTRSRRTQARVYVFVPRARLCTRSAA